MLQRSETKVCCTCGAVKPLSEFHKFAKAADGHQVKCRACCALYQAEYNALHGKERALRRAEQAAANPMREMAAKSRWAAMHRVDPESARQAELVDSVVDLRELWTGHCALCLQEIDPDLKHPDPMSKSVDHIIPVSRGGGHVQSNLQWTHRVCNTRKGNRV